MKKRIMELVDRLSETLHYVGSFAKAKKGRRLHFVIVTDLQKRGSLDASWLLPMTECDIFRQNPVGIVAYELPGGPDSDPTIMAAYAERAVNEAGGECQAVFCGFEDLGGRFDEQKIKAALRIPREALVGAIIPVNLSDEVPVNLPDEVPVNLLNEIPIVRIE